MRLNSMIYFLIMNTDRLRRHVKIVCTLGPASNTPEIIEKMILSGMDVARLNLSYGTLDEHRNTVAMVRAAAGKIGLPTAVLLDCPGRKRRTGDTRAVFGDHLQFARDNQLDYIALSFYYFDGTGRRSTGAGRRNENKYSHRLQNRKRRGAGGQ